MCEWIICDLNSIANKKDKIPAKRENRININFVCFHIL